MACTSRPAPLPEQQQADSVIEFGVGEQHGPQGRPGRRPGGRGCRAGKDPIWAWISGEALSRNQRRWSALTATDDWVRGRAGREPSRTARHGGQVQFHCGNPPPAAEPSTRTHMPIRRPSGARAFSARASHRDSVPSGIPCLGPGRRRTDRPAPFPSSPSPSRRPCRRSPPLTR